MKKHKSRSQLLRGLRWAARIVLLVSCGFLLFTVITRLRFPPPVIAPTVQTGENTQIVPISPVVVEEIGDKTSPPVQNTLKPSEKDTTPWGIAKQIDDHTWTMKIEMDPRIATPREIQEALNEYRRQHGAGYLTWDDTLAGFAKERAIYLNGIQSTDQHKGFSEYVNDEENLKKLGFWSVGENISFGYRLYGVHLIEWVFAGDEPHDKNQLDTSWSHVGIGVDGLAVCIIFGGWKI